MNTVHEEEEEEGKDSVIFYAGRKESHGSGRCWSESCVCLMVSAIIKSSRTELSYISAIFTSDSQSILF